MKRSWSFCADQGKECNITNININRMHLGRHISHSDFILSPKLNCAQLADVWKLTRCWLGFLVSLCPLKESSEFQQKPNKKPHKIYKLLMVQKNQMKEDDVLFLAVHELVSPVGASSELK